MLPALFLFQPWGQHARGEQGAKTVITIPSLKQMEVQAQHKASHSSSGIQTERFGTFRPGPDHSFYEVRTLCSLDSKPGKKAAESNGTTAK